MQDMSERPGPDIGRPQQQHQIIAMLWLLSTSQNQAEAQVILAALQVLVRELWGWEADRLKRELVEAESVLRTYSGRTTFWFSDEGMHFDYHCSAPVESN
jgi:hypothetical protein